MQLDSIKSSQLFYKKSILFLLGILLPLAAFGEDFQTTDLSTTELSSSAWITLIIFFITLVSLIRESHPPDITMLFGAGALLIFGVITPEEFLSGFSNDILLTIAMLCTIIRAVEVNGILESISRKILSKSKNFYKQMLSLTVPVSCASAFLNNTPIVLLLTPVVRKWALSIGESASKFLIPLSYATILGGMCTIIGTSTNLIVEGLLREHSPESALSFFEIAWVGVPCCIVGIGYLLSTGKYLPIRQDPATAIAEETREFTVEFLVKKSSPLIDKKIKEVSGIYFPEEFLIQVERGNTLIDSPARDFLIKKGDRLVFTGDINHIAELHSIEGLESLADPHFKLDVSSSHFSEVVISMFSDLIGKTLKKIHFRRTYGASVMAVYRQGERVLGKVGNITLEAGDTLMLLSSEAWRSEEPMTKNFYIIRNNEKLLTFNPWRAAIVIGAILSLILLSIVGVPIALTSTLAAFFLLATKMISLREFQKSISWNILLLIGFSFAFGKAMETTGIAAYFAHFILSIVGSHPQALIGGILFITILGTEFMSNNASALIFFPIALKMASLSGYESTQAIKAIGVAVAFGSSCGFAIPTGYQTHMIVYGPGGYRFTDFLKVGLPLDILIFLVGTLLIPYFWPLQ